MTALFCFRRDLRLSDNTGLLYALKNYNVLPIFIFDINQINFKKNEYFSKKCFDYMIMALRNLDSELRIHKTKLYCFMGEPHKVITDLCRVLKISTVVINKDYTPYSLERDSKISKICDLIIMDDLCLNKPESIKTKSDTYYRKFTPYYNVAVKNKVDKPATLTTSLSKNFTKLPKNIKQINLQDFKTQSLESNFVPKSKSEYKKQIQNALKQYHITRDIPDLWDKGGTTLLSAPLKFGVISPRQVYHFCYSDSKANKKSREELIRQLYWRDFYIMVAYTSDVLCGQIKNQKNDVIQSKWDKWALELKDVSFGKSITLKPGSSQQKKNKFELFQKWCAGQTGIPIIDASMRHMNEIGFMPNRCRMLVASILTKNLKIDWRLGEKYFATKLVDYDPANNNGGWQWVAGTGVDAQPYYRVFNPWTQTKKYDPDCLYVRKWVKELKDVPVKTILKWNELYDVEKNKIKYYEPII